MCHTKKFHLYKFEVLTVRSTGTRKGCEIWYHVLLISDNLAALFQLRVQCNHLPSDIQELVTGPPHGRTDVSYVCMLSEVCNPQSYPAVLASQHWKLPDDIHLWVLVYSSEDILTPGKINTTIFTEYYKEELQAHACMLTHTHSLFIITHNKHKNSSTPKNKPRSSYKHRVSNAVLARHGTWQIISTTAVSTAYNMTNIVVQTSWSSS